MIAAIALLLAVAGPAHPGLANATVLIVRHAEKPASGRDLSPMGVQRAQAYAKYFDPLHLKNKTYLPQYIVATADSASSMRPRLTCQPTAQALSLSMNTQYADNQFADLASFLEGTPHGNTILICWHHGEIPQLIGALGGDSKSILGVKKWPENVFGWLVVLKYDAQGELKKAELVHEDLMPDDTGQ